MKNVWKLFEFEHNQFLVTKHSDSKGFFITCEIWFGNNGKLKMTIPYKTEEDLNSDFECFGKGQARFYYDELLSKAPEAFKYSIKNTD